MKAGSIQDQLTTAKSALLEALRMAETELRPSDPLFRLLMTIIGKVEYLQYRFRARS